MTAHKRPKSKQLLQMTSNIVFDSFSIRFLVNHIQKYITTGTCDETLNDQEGLVLP
jgi:hypothetical protein